MMPVGGQPAFGVERRHAAAAGRGDRLAIIIVGHVAGGKHALDAGVGAERDGPLDVFLVGQLQLAFEKGRVGRVADGQEHARRVELACRRRRPCCRAARRSRPAWSLPSTSARWWFQTISILGLFSARSAMIFEARSLSRRWTM